MHISEIKPNPNNPRTIEDDRLKKLVRSIKEFPQMLELRPMVVDDDNVLLGGNMRLRAIELAGITEIPDAWVKRVSGFSEEEKNEFIIKDNLGYGEWDWDVLTADWNVPQLEEWGLEFPEKEGTGGEKEAHEKLTDTFLVPPFTVLDSRQGYWQERKRYWRELIGDKGESRENTLAAGDKNIVGTINTGVSLLDPVLSELVNLWFGIPGGKTFDPFAGDSVFGYVSAHMGMEFSGIELRKEQADLNTGRVVGMSAKYICDDGRNVLNHIPEKTMDLLFSCPPYFDLEVYSDLPNDASNQKEYKQFLAIIETAFGNAIKCLKDNRFAVVTCGDIRDKRGFYYRFQDDIKNIFATNGMKLYNELILVESIGTLPQRARRFMEHRKIGKCHQNVLVFFKGDPKQIKSIFPTVELQIEQTDEIANS